MSLKNRAENCIGQGCLTNSKHWAGHVQGIFPTHIKASTGPYLIAENNRKYMDFIGGLGTNILGYGHPLVEAEVATYRNQGKSPSLPHVLEVEVAEQLKQVFPWIQKWKIVKSGSEACSAAIRMARTYTGRSQIVSDGYHGWHDLFTYLTPPAHGVTDDHDIIKMVDLEEPETRTAAAVIVEPVITDDSTARIEKLKKLQSYCSETGAVLIFDEVITGVRYKQHSVAKAYNLRPDMIVVGKAIANGYALAAVGGPAEILDGDYFVSSTYAGELSALAACKATLKIIRENPNYSVDQLWKAGAEFCKGFNEAAKPLGFELKGYPTRGVLAGNMDAIAIFRQEACLAGYLFGPSWFISFAHLPMLSHALKHCRDIMLKMAKNMPKLKGEAPRSPFAMRVRNGK